jgi:hypothetical protein
MEALTEYGKCEFGIVKEKNAKKEYTCPLCDSLIEIGEKHYFTWPESMLNLRRHLHIECVDAWLAQNLTITLHPNRIT